jgi:hypothetical protein
VTRPILLDLFCGLGGASRGYQDAGFDVVGVDIKPQPDYPYELVQGDAVVYLLQHGRQFDAVHASPPCQASSAATKGNRKRAGWSDTHVDLIPLTRAALNYVGVPYVIENVQDGGGGVKRPELDTYTRSLAAVYVRDTDPAGTCVAGLLAHIKALDGHIDAAESQVLESARLRDVAELEARRLVELRTVGGPAPATTTTWVNRASVGGAL